MELVAGLLSCALRSVRCLDERSSTLSSRAAPCRPSPDIAGVVGAITVDPSAGPHPPDSCAHEEHMSTQIEVLWAFSGRLPPDGRRCRGAQETTGARRLTGGVRALRWNDDRMTCVTVLLSSARVCLVATQEAGHAAEHTSATPFFVSLLRCQQAARRRPGVSSQHVRWPARWAWSVPPTNSRPRAHNFTCRQFFSAVWMFACQPAGGHVGCFPSTPRRSESSMHDHVSWCPQPRALLMARHAYPPTMTRPKLPLVPDPLVRYFVTNKQTDSHDVVDCVGQRWLRLC
jgi:hypothetical protein